ncbi:uncharacterized protein LOC144126131 [Amblyomma americanum]
MRLSMEKECCVKGCSANSEKDNTKVSFFKFPKARSFRRVWEKAINVKGFKSDDATLVCSRHFSGEHVRVIRGNSILKKNAVPELNLKPETPPPNRKKLAKQPKTADKKNAAKCLVCQQPVVFMYEFLTDAHAHKAACTLKKFICGHCLQEFERFCDLMAHITDIGPSKQYVPDRTKVAPLPQVVPRRQYPCTQCSSVFLTPTARLYHEVTHSAADEEDFCKQLNLKVRHANETEDSSPKKPFKPGRRVKILAADPSEIYFDEPRGNKRNETPVKMQRVSPAKKQHELSTKRKNEPPAKKLCKANSQSGRKQLNTISSLPPHQKQQLVSAVYCNQCDQQFSTLKLLDKHYWSQHSDMDIPLDLVFEVDSGDVLPKATVCLACTKRTACVNTIEALLDETAKDIETIH